MRKFTYSDATSHKFWNIEVDGDSHTVTYGKIGTKGQSKTKSFSDEDEAQKDADKLIAQKVKKGYQEVIEESSTQSGDDVTQRKLEEAINADPSDVGAHAAYADFLMEQGDSQGEFIQAELALNDESLKAAERKKLKSRSSSLLKKHHEEWVGEWVKKAPESEADGGQIGFDEPKPARFINGIFAEVALEEMSFECAKSFVACKEVRMVRHLRISHYRWSEEEAEEGVEIPEEWDAGEYAAQNVILRWDGLKNLRIFQYGWTPEEEYDDWCSFRCHESMENTHQFVKQMPLIEELYLFAHGVPGKKLFALPMPKLRVLQMYHSWEYPLTTLAKNESLKNLTHLLLHPHALEYGDSAYINIGDLRAILKSPHLQNLTHLRLRLADFGNKGCQEIVKSDILKRLEVLDLRHGCVTDEGAKILAECDDLKHLEHLDLKANFITKAGLDLLKETGVSLNVSHQNEGEPDMEEAEWLGQGDYE